MDTNLILSALPSANVVTITNYLTVYVVPTNSEYISTTDLVKAMGSMGFWPWVLFLLKLASFVGIWLTVVSKVVNFREPAKASDNKSPNNSQTSKAVANGKEPQSTIKAEFPPERTDDAKIKQIKPATGAAPQQLQAPDAPPLVESPPKPESTEQVPLVAIQAAEVAEEPVGKAAPNATGGQVEQTIIPDKDPEDSKPVKTEYRITRGFWLFFALALLCFFIAILCHTLETAIARKKNDDAVAKTTLQINDANLILSNIQITAEGVQKQLNTASQTLAIASSSFDNINQLNTGVGKVQLNISNLGTSVVLSNQALGLAVQGVQTQIQTASDSAISLAETNIYFQRLTLENVIALDYMTITLDLSIDPGDSADTRKFISQAANSIRANASSFIGSTNSEPINPPACIVIPLTNSFPINSIYSTGLHLDPFASFVKDTTSAFSFLEANSGNQFINLKFCCHDEAELRLYPSNQFVLRLRYDSPREDWFTASKSFNISKLDNASLIVVHQLQATNNVSSGLHFALKGGSVAVRGLTFPIKEPQLATKKTHLLHTDVLGDVIHCTLESIVPQHSQN